MILISYNKKVKQEIPVSLLFPKDPMAHRPWWHGL